LSKASNYQAVKNDKLIANSGYSLANPTVSVLSDRPAYGGTCYSPIYEATPVIVTAYGATGPTATITYSASATDAQAYAFPIDGFAYGVAEVASLGTAATTGTASSSSVSSTSTSSAAATTYTVSSFTKWREKIH
jgi:hypothetical protein